MISLHQEVGEEVSSKSGYSSDREECGSCGVTENVRQNICKMKLKKSTLAGKGGGWCFPFVYPSLQHWKVTQVS